MPSEIPMSPVPASALQPVSRRARLQFDVGQLTKSAPSDRARLAVWARTVVIFTFCLIAVIGLQRWTGAYGAEAGRYSDDAAHFMNGMVIRDYLTTGLGQNPVTFAENYYLSYPKIAPLMWPPLFHVTLGLLLLLGGPPGVTALLLVGATAAWLLWRLHSMVEHLSGPVPAILAAGLTLLTPLVAAMSGAVMLDVAIAAIGLEAAYWLARYAQSGLRRHAVIFGVCAAAACLTKGNGVAVVLLPFAFMLLTGRYDLLRARGLYVSAAIVLFGAVPILALSARFDAAIGDFGPVTPTLVLQRVAFYSAQLWTQLGPVLVGLCTAGLVVAFVPRLRRAAVVILPRERHRTSPELPIAEALASLVLASVVFHLLVPHTITVNRYLTMTIAPLIGLGCAAVWTALCQIRQERIRHVAGVVAIAVIVVGSWTSRPFPRITAPMGYRDTIEYLHQIDALRGARLLVISDEFGEGAFVSEAARLGLHPAPTMIRGSKLLASDDWGGRFFHLRYASPKVLMKDLEDMHVSYVLVDLAPGSAQLPYFDQIMRLAATEPARFQAVNVASGEAHGAARSLTLYRVTTPSPGAAKPVEIDLKYSLGKTLAK
jgi:hypothetical protein